MDNFNNIINIVKEALPLVQSGIPALVGGFVTAMFLRGNTSRAEFEKIKAGKIKEALDDLVNSHELTLTELVKCKNLLKIAEIADREYAKKNENDINEQNKEFNFDWFLRFFETAGCVSNDNMQLLWAKILSSKMRNSEMASLRLLDTLRTMDYEDAKLFESICPYLVQRVPFNDIVLPEDLQINKIDGIRHNLIFDISPFKISHLCECKLIDYSKISTIYPFSADDIHGWMYDNDKNPKKHHFMLNALRNDNFILIINDIKEYYLVGHYLTPVGKELFEIIKTQQDPNFMKEMGKVFKRVSQDVTLHRVTSYNDSTNIIEYENEDILSDY